MAELDKMRDSLVNELIILSHRAGLSSQHIERLPRLERKHALEVIEKVIKEEQKQVTEMNRKMGKK